MPEGANVVTEGLGSMTMTTEGFGYEPRRIYKEELLRQLSAMPKLRSLEGVIADLFVEMRSTIGPESAVDAIWATIDKTILSQPGVYARPRDMSTTQKMVYGLSQIQEREAL